MNEKIDRFSRIDCVEGVTPDYKEAVVKLQIAPSALNTYNGQVMLIVSCNILSRWVKKLVVDVPEETSCVIKKYKGRNLRDVISDIVTAGREDLQSTFDSASLTQFTLSIGERAPGNAVWINCNGWLAGYGYNWNDIPQANPANSVVSASFAACLGVAEIFRQAIGITPQKFKKWFSLHNFESSSNFDGLPNPAQPAQVNLGTVHQIGCGAIGSSFDFILSLAENVEAKLFLVDHDRVEEHNRPASLAFTPDDATSSAYKVDACLKSLTGVIPAERFHGDFNAFVTENKYRENPPDIILCFANERNIWSTIQQKCPPLTFHATTTKSWGTNFGRHIPQKDWCLMCRFEKEIQQVARMACAEGNISIEPDKEVLGVLPFLAAASAIITLAALHRLNYQTFISMPNFLQFSMKSPNGIFVPMEREPKGCLACKEQEADIFPRYIQESMHWHLSQDQKSPIKI
jgi:hypothetical protein